MFKIPLNDIIAKIKQSSSLSEEEINKKIDDKLEELSGLISKEGAAHIIANELGVKLFEQAPPGGSIKIKDIYAGMRGVDTLGKVTRKFELREFKTEKREGKVASMIIGDETSTIRVVMWGDQTENINKLNEGDIVKIIGGYARESQGNKEIHLNDRAKLTINPEGETVGEVATTPSRPSAQRKQIKDLSEEDQNVEILGTVVQVFEPKFFEVHPDTGRRIRPNEEGKYIDDEGKEVNPDYSYVMNAVLDDGTETIRCTFFRNQADRLLDKTPEQMQDYRKDPSAFEPMKTELLGNIVKLVGKVNKNEMFDRTEFISQLVFPNPDPKEEIERLQSESKSSTSEEKTEEEKVTEEVEKIN